MKTVNKANSSEKSNFSFKNGALTVGLAITMLLSSCGKQTKQDIAELQKDSKQTEQIDSLQNAWLKEQGNDIVKIRKILEENDIKFEEIDTINRVQTEKIAKLYEDNAEFREEMDKLNKCCDAKNGEKEATVTPKKTQTKKVEITIEQENTPADTTKTVKQWPKKDGEAFSF